MWVITFALYLPAARAGFVADFTGWLDQTLHFGFWDNMNRTHFQVQSLYQFTQLNTWLYFQAFGARPWAWHLLFVTLHALNASLLYKLCRDLFIDARIANAGFISLAGALLFCITPHASEVVVWEPSFHYLQGMLLILLILNWCVRYLHTGRSQYAWLAGITFLLSTFSLEIFYITPWLVISLLLFYRYKLNHNKVMIKGATLLFFLPQIIMFLGHLVLFKIVYGGWVAHIGGSATTFDLFANLGKPAKHLFHILFLGRFFPAEIRQKVYVFCDSTAGIVGFYGLIAFLLGYLLIPHKRADNTAAMAGIMLIWVMITLALLIPIWFGDMMLVIYDRYTYFTNAFVYMLLSLLVSYISIPSLRLAVLGLYTLINLRFAVQLSRYWMKSERIVNSLLQTFPYNAGKTVIMLNLPQNMQGASMIGAEHESEFRLMHDDLLPEKKILPPVYDAMAFNMLTPDDGAYVNVLNDSTVRVTLNQWGTWWWFGMKGGYSYENADYKLDLKDPGHFYELTLKKPMGQYLLLYQVGKDWKTVDISRKNVEQD